MSKKDKLIGTRLKFHLTHNFKKWCMTIGWIVGGLVFDHYLNFKCIGHVLKLFVMTSFISATWAHFFIFTNEIYLLSVFVTMREDITQKLKLLICLSQDTNKLQTQKILKIYQLFDKQIREGSGKNYFNLINI